jgi:hypothetical protein
LIAVARWLKPATENNAIYTIAILGVSNIFQIPVAPFRNPQFEIRNEY